MQNKLKFSAAFAITLVIALAIISPVSAQEPMIVLSPSHSYATSSTSDNAFAQDHNYSTKHKVLPNESLSNIIANYYAGSDVNRKFLTLAIVQKNPRAFVRANPHFLYAGRTLHLPSLSEIQAMILNEQSPSTSGNYGGSDAQSQIYFHGF